MMQFNLIDERWIPVKRRDGTPDVIRPWEVTDRFSDNPVVSLNAPRPDFNGALIQFLIGLVQTTFAPANEIKWRERLLRAPNTQELQAAFKNFRHAFDLGGEGPRFMQDFDDLTKKTKKSKQIDWLFIGAATDNTLKENRDHFIKRDAIAAVCPACCAIALFAMQTNSPMGGRELRTSLRGGGPLTTLLIGDEQFRTLWHTVWLNVLESPVFLNMSNSGRNKDVDMFPWLARTRSSATEQDIHPAQYFWAMPRRIRLNFDRPASGFCGVCSREDERLITRYVEVKGGTQYQAPMKHPLSPFDGNRKKAVLAQPGGVTYRHWLGLIVNDSEGKREPSRGVHEFTFERQQPTWPLRLWAFGYDMDNMKARCWYDTTMAFITIKPACLTDYENAIARIVNLSVAVCRNLVIAVKRTFYGTPVVNAVNKEIKWKYKDIKNVPNDEEKEHERVINSVKDRSFFAAIESEFWQRTEASFYETLRLAKDQIENGQPVFEAMKKWYDVLCSEAEHQFDANVMNCPIEDGNPRKIVLALNEMQKYNGGKKIKDLLGLP